MAAAVPPPHIRLKVSWGRALCSVAVVETVQGPRSVSSTGGQREITLDHWSQQPQDDGLQGKKNNCENSLIKLYTPAPPPAPPALPPPLCTTTENAVKETEDDTMGSTFRGICGPCTLPGVWAVRHAAVRSSVKLTDGLTERFFLEGANVTSHSQSKKCPVIESQHPAPPLEHVEVKQATTTYCS
ncbi:unnamed protein product [Pleuronectes platessa]|uniref:Uncharacterized protein n=1 Tax=Pleuronectes platessa TaxID=8262 RepID=A0A9N7YNC0_PLEPL|nr:unnamed protein product [Pleuronectes platessa]